MGEKPATLYRASDLAYLQQYANLISQRANGVGLRASAVGGAIVEELDDFQHKNAIEAAGLLTMQPVMRNVMGAQIGIYYMNDQIGSIGLLTEEGIAAAHAAWKQPDYLDNFRNAPLKNLYRIGQLPLWEVGPGSMKVGAALDALEYYTSKYSAQNDPLDLF